MSAPLDILGAVALDGPGTLLVKDSVQLSATFTVPWLLRAYVNQGHRVVLVAAGTCQDRVASLAKKLGVGAALSGSPPQLQVLPVGLQQQDGLECTGVLRRLLLQLKAAITAAAAAQQQEGSQPVTVIIDSLANLRVLASTPAEWLAWLHYVRGLQQQVQGQYTLVALAHTDIPDDEQWVALLEHQADVVLELHQLEGRTADIDGQLDIRWRTSGQRSREGTGSMHPQQQEQQQQEQHWLRQQAGGDGTSDRYFFRAGESNIRWVRSVGANDIL